MVGLIRENVVNWKEEIMQFQIHRQLEEVRGIQSDGDRQLVLQTILGKCKQMVEGLFCQLKCCYRTVQEWEVLWELAILHRRSNYSTCLVALHSFLRILRGYHQREIKSMPFV